jgi:protein SCO1
MVQKGHFGAPTNWHFLSVTFDTEYDTPAVLKAYAQRFHYDPAHWSFLTGPPDKIAELAASNDVNFDRKSGFTITTVARSSSTGGRVANDVSHHGRHL